MWLVIVNTITCKRGWMRWKQFLDSHEIPYDLHQTSSLGELKTIIEKSFGSGQRKYLFVGGDGTVHHGGNILLKTAGDRSYEITMGVLPCGTGNDWVRSYGVDKKKLAKSIKEEYTAPLNVMKVMWPDGRIHYGINMVGGALDASVVLNIKRGWIRYPSFILYPYWLFRTLLKPHTWKGKIIVDGDVHEGSWLTMQAGFGKYCGGGMYVLPHAREDSPGLLLMKPKALIRILLSTSKIYSGKIIHDKKSIPLHFEIIEVQHDGKPIPFEADGEFMGYSPLKMEAKFDAMKRIV